MDLRRRYSGYSDRLSEGRGGSGGPPLVSDAPASFGARHFNANAAGATSPLRRGYLPPVGHHSGASQGDSTRKDRSVGRGNPLGLLPLAAWHALDVVPPSSKPSAGVALFFSKRGHARGLPGGGVKAGVGTSRPFPLRPSAWRCQRGPSWRPPRGAQSEASRQAAQRPQPPKVWQADPTSSSVGLCPRRNPVLWRAFQSRPRGHLHGPVLHSCSTLGAGPTDQQCANALQSGTPSVMLVGGAINCFWTSPVERAASQRPSKLLDVPPRPWTSSMVLSMMSRGPLLWTSSWDGWRPALSWASGVALLTLLGLRRGLAPLGLVGVLGGPIAT